MKLAWKLLTGAGLLLVLVALGVDTTVETGYGGRVHNLGMQQQQLMLLIFGCVLFLAGIVLFGVMKLKQTPEEEQAEARERAEARARAKTEQEALRAEERAAKKTTGWELPPGSKQVELKGDVSDFSRR